LRTSRFLAVLLVPVLGLAGWIAYDATRPGEKVPEDTRVRYGILKSGAQYGAPVLFHFHFAEPVVIHDKSSAEIEVIRRQQKDPAVEKILGLTTGDFKQDCTYIFRTRKKFLSKGYLLWVEDLKVVLSADNLKVYVAREYPEGSCEYEETLRHEMRHVEIHREVYAKYSRELEEALSRAQGIPGKTRPLLVGDPDLGSRRLAQLIEGVVNPVFEAFQKELGERQDELDTPEEYRSIQSRCSNW
jgi:hypothetical protein